MRTTIGQIARMKREARKIPMLTAYDYPTARILDEAGVPMILVGDSLGMVVLGYESTIPVTLAMVLHHTRAVARGAKRALIVADMPFMTYRTSMRDALSNAGRLIQEGGAQAVKLEGGGTVAETVRRLVECGIPVQGHIGLTPRSIHQLGGYSVQGKTREAAQRLLADALALEEAGAFSIVLELVPSPLDELISTRLTIPTIGIGAGPSCDGQVQVITDILGLTAGYVPRHARRYADLGAAMREAVSRYVTDVEHGEFPGPEETSRVDSSVIEWLALDGANERELESRAGPASSDHGARPAVPRLDEGVCIK